MTIHALDPNTALLIVDLQKGFAGLQTAHLMKDVVGNAVALLEAFRRQGLPVVLVNVDGRAPGRSERSFATQALPADWTELLPELNRQPSDHAVTKRTWGAFTNTDLEAHLRGRGITQAVIGGVSTSAGVESTARQAHELGFNVALAVDAMTDLNAEAHHNSVTHIFPRLGETGTTQDILNLVNAGSQGQRRS
ncbi:MAG TPA: isochorismatase family protein [Bradyrhizobium sp.]|nr:isochorismatase family protein [Bradyrhizobium sp.]